VTDFLLQAGSALGLFYGLWWMGNARLRGPIITMFAELLTLIVGLRHDVWSLALIGFVLTIVQGRNAIKWSWEGVEW
jgi:hypothetical protein